ncbi:MAG TPA: DUF4157 domain-containing protein [Thermoanaerobaculia bacterium]|jgi:hypothetical protein|nr:DUF4157 domain-containing protein [Thermoanaerobaculia bacterium]
MRTFAEPRNRVPERLSPRRVRLFPLQRKTGHRLVPPTPAQAGGPDAGPASRPAFGFARDFNRISAEAVRGAAALGTSDGFGPIPHLTAIRRSFGRHGLSEIHAHQGPRAAAAARSLGARAFTTGGHVVFAESPDLHTAAHEAAHVVQQRAGVQLSGDVGVTGDPYERHADAVAERVVRGESAEALLSEMAPRGSAAPGARWQGVQCAPVKTDYGEFDTTTYKSQGAAGGEYGVEIALEFDPDKAKVDARQIGLVQSVRVRLGGKRADLWPSHAGRVVPSGTGEGFQIDRQYGNFGNPLYATGETALTDKLPDTPADPEWGRHGWHYTDAAGAVQHRKALLKDKPSLQGHSKNASQEFETAALAVEGTQSGTYMGSVTWGWNVDAKGKFTLMPLTLKSKGDPSGEFLAAARQWNKTSVGGTVETIADPTNVYDPTSGYSVMFTVAKGTKVRVSEKKIFIHDNVVYSVVEFLEGSEKGYAGLVKVTDLKETGGTPVIPLPIPTATPTSVPTSAPAGRKRRKRK